MVVLFRKLAGYRFDGSNNENAANKYEEVQEVSTVILSIKLAQSFTEEHENGNQGICIVLECDWFVLES